MKAQRRWLIDEKWNGDTCRRHVCCVGVCARVQTFCPTYARFALGLCSGLGLGFVGWVSSLPRVMCTRRALTPPSPWAAARLPLSATGSLVGMGGSIVVGHMGALGLVPQLQNGTKTVPKKQPSSRLRRDLEDRSGPCGEPNDWISSLIYERLLFGHGFSAVLKLRD